MVSHKSISNQSDMDKLPLWVQQGIWALRRDNQKLREELGAGPEDSDTFVDGWNTNPDRPLGKRPTINFGVQTFKTATGEHRSPVFQVRWVEENQEIYVSSHTGRVLVLPEATNTFRVRIGK